MVSELILISLTKYIQKWLRLLLKLEGVFLSIYKLLKVKKNKIIKYVLTNIKHIKNLLGNEKISPIEFEIIQ